MQTYANLMEAAKKNKVVLMVLVLLGITALVTLVPTGITAKSYIYADSSNKGSQDGSYNHPYRKIQDAIDKAHKQKKDVIVKKGTYVENIVISEDVEVIGSGKDNTIITSAKRDENVVEMHDDTLIRKVTIRSGHRGVEIKSGARATIEDCKIKNNRRDGVKILEAKTDDEHKVKIEDCDIHDNGWNGIYSQEREVLIRDNEIRSNGKDGVELEGGTEGYFEGNQIRYNDGDGLRLTIDDSELWTKNNTYYGNDKDGVEVQAKGKHGMIGIENSKLYKNNKNGIARVEKAPFSDQQWANSLILRRNIFWENDDQEVSNIINEY